MNEGLIQTITRARSQTYYPDKRRTAEAFVTKPTKFSRALDTHSRIFAERAMGAIKLDTGIAEGIERRSTMSRRIAGDTGEMIGGLVSLLMAGRVLGKVSSAYKLGQKGYQAVRDIEIANRANELYSQRKSQ